MKARRITVVASFAAATMALSTSTAMAGTDAIAYTSDAGWGGWAKFVSNGDRLDVCDTRADGKRVHGELLYTTSTGSYRRVAEDTDGANNACASKSGDIPEGTSVTVRVCLKDGANGAEEYCATKRGTA
ncbi:hypothetical protein [Streptomyces sp. BE133]|uniref:hypothetical protein n=1 Tax=Streptomyces sp. BE133 TaxID=3002523 RepID=UPI002E7A3B6B|nr:hypothetical protein [Streptomyces sp. BE133]MEE1812027.1 hypothetical protein [Streptomyces sp. BE133]